MRKLLIKLLIMSLLVCLIAQYISNYFIPNDKFIESHKEFKNLISEKDISVLFLGSSKSYCSFNPSVFNYYLGGNSFNLASSSQLLETTNFLLKENLKKNKIDIVIIEFSRGLVSLPNPKDTLTFEKSKYFQQFALDQHNFSFNKWSIVNKFYKKPELLNAFSPLIRNHSKWDSFPKLNIIKKPFTYGQNDIKFYNHGYTTSNSAIATKHALLTKALSLPYETALNSLKSNVLAKVGEKEINLVKEIEEITKKHESKVLFVTSPTIYDYNHNLGYYKNFEPLMDSLNINYLNLNKLIQEIDLTAEDFIDLRHLNYQGSLKVSEYMSKYIKEKFKLNNTKDVVNDCKDITCHFYNNLKDCNELLTEEIIFNEDIKINKINYFNEVNDQYVFIFDVSDSSNFYEIENYICYIRYYNDKVDESTKNVEGFSIKNIKINNKTYFFKRLIIPKSNITKFDVFFVKKGTSKSSKFLTIKKLKLKSNAN